MEKREILNQLRQLRKENNDVRVQIVIGISTDEISDIFEGNVDGAFLRSRNRQTSLLKHILATMNVVEIIKLEK